MNRRMRSIAFRAQATCHMLQVIALWCGFFLHSEAAVAKAKHKKPVAVANKTDDNATNEEDGKSEAQKHYEKYGPWTIYVPAEYIHQDYALRISGKLIPLSQEKITLQGKDDRERIELVDEAQRQLSVKTAYVDPYVFEDVNVRKYRLAAYFGNIQINGSPLHNILLGSALSESSVDLDIQPSKFGLRMTYAELTSGDTHKYSDANGGTVTASFETQEYRLLGLYEWAPLAANTTSFLQRVHADFGLGLFTARQSVTIADNLVKIADDGHNVGVISSVDLLYPVGHWWFGSRSYVSYQRLQLPRLGLQKNLVERAFDLGVGYAW